MNLPYVNWRELYENVWNRTSVFLSKPREYPMKLVAFEPFGMLFPVSLQSRLDARSWYLQRCRLQNPQFWILNQPFSYFRFPIKHKALFCTVPILVFIRMFPWVSTHIERHVYVLSQLVSCFLTFKNESRMHCGCSFTLLQQNGRCFCMTRVVYFCFFHRHVFLC